MTYFKRLILASLTVIAGCGGGSGHTPPADFDAFLTQFMDTLCRLDVGCGTMPDMATCVATLQVDTTEFATLRADIASGKVRFDSASASACIDYANRLYAGPCTRSMIAANTAAVGENVCDKFLVGAVAEGGACFSSYECASGTCTLTDTACLRAHQCCAGTCAAATVEPTPIPAGGDCSALLPGQGCVAGAYCVSNTCRVPSKVAGTACTSALFDCASPLFCALDAAGGNGTCQPAAATGAPCNTVSSYGVCDDIPDYCDKTTATCTPRVGVGGACDATAANCVGYATCLGGTCVAMSTARGACNDASGPSCLGDLECSATTSTCGFPDSASGPCS
jgi:hypothetical protein